MQRGTNAVLELRLFGLPHQAIPAHHEANARPAVRGVKHGDERGKLRKVHTWQSIGAGEGLGICRAQSALILLCNAFATPFAALCFDHRPWRNWRLLLHPRQRTLTRKPTREGVSIIEAIRNG